MYLHLCRGRRRSNRHRSVCAAKAADPLSRALQLAGLPTASWVVAFGAVVSLTAVLLVFQYGQPRIFFAMARDGLLPPWAAKVHPRFRTPHITTVVTGLLVACGALFFDENEIYDLTNIGTLAAFAIVCVGVLVLRYSDRDRPRPFRVPALPLVAAIRRRLGLPLYDEGTARYTHGSVSASGSPWVWRSYFAYGFRHSTLRRGASSRRRGTAAAAQALTHCCPLRCCLGVGHSIVDLQPLKCCGLG